MSPSSYPPRVLSLITPCCVLSGCFHPQRDVVEFAQSLLKAESLPLQNLRSAGLITTFSDFLFTLYSRRFLILEMARRDVASQHLGSLLGFFWTILHPVIWILILWIVFDLGFKVAPTNDVPFVVWLTAGLAVWNFFSEVVRGSTSSIVEHSYLVKKIVFPLSILPVVKLLTALVTHAIFILLLILLITLYGLPFSLYWIQALYYLGAMALLGLGLSWITSAVNVFFRDTHQIVAVLLQFGFWATPIFWDPNIMPEQIQYLLKLNPLYYIVEGYRGSFIYSVAFWENLRLTACFWSFTGLAFSSGVLVFRLLRPHFSDII